ncbi:hypothetical protein ACIPK7_11315 [Pseudomonas sp. NPDC086581]|uniref:hypothetical protein n=1 Tax=Pseudomonas sp. NPDC086581 TaxID=3364432 RepID=UPI0037FBDE0A
MMALNEVKGLVSSLADSQGVSGEWSINGDVNIDEELSKYLANFKIELELLSKAVGENDLITAKCALVMMRLYSLNLSNLFLDIFEDIERVGWSKEGALPNVPEGYQIPDSYNYKKK